MSSPLPSHEAFVIAAYKRYHFEHPVPAAHGVHLEHTNVYYEMAPYLQKALGMHRVEGEADERHDAIGNVDLVVDR